MSEYVIGSQITDPPDEVWQVDPAKGDYLYLPQSGMTVRVDGVQNDGVVRIRFHDGWVRGLAGKSVPATQEQIRRFRERQSEYS